MTATVLTVVGIAIVTVSFLTVVYWAIVYFTRDTGTHAAPRHQRDDWDEPDPDDEWLTSPLAWPAPEMAHDEEALDAWHQLLNERQAALDDREAALEERLSSTVVVADVYHPTPPGPPGDWEWREPFAWWLSDTNVGGMLAITDGRTP